VGFHGWSVGPGGGRDSRRDLDALSDRDFEALPYIAFRATTATVAVEQLI
jgi:hypothetical protein